MIVAQAAPHLEAWPLPLSKQIQIGCPNKDSKTLQHLIKSLEKDTSVKSSLSAQCCGHGTFVPQSNRCCDRSVSASRNLSPIFDSLLTCVLLQLGEGGVHHPPPALSIQPFTITTAIHRGGGPPPPPSCIHRGGGVHHPPPSCREQGGVGPPPPPSCRQTGRGGSTTPPPQLPTIRREGSTTPYSSSRSKSSFRFWRD